MGTHRELDQEFQGSPEPLAGITKFNTMMASGLSLTEEHRSIYILISPSLIRTTLKSCFAFNS